MDFSQLLGMGTPPQANVPPPPPVPGADQTFAIPDPQASIQAIPLPPNVPAPVVPGGAPPAAQVPAPPPAAEPPVAPPAKPGLLDKIRTDPNLMQAALMTGLRLMHGQQNGQDTMGLVSDALMAGNMTYQFGQQNQADEADKEKEAASVQEARAAQTEAARERMAGDKQRRTQDAELFPQTKAKLEQDLANAKTQGEINEAKKNQALFDSDPQRMADKFKLDQQAKQANINQSNAAAGASSASARASNARTADVEEEAKMRKWAASGTPEQKAEARAYFKVSMPEGRAGTARTDELKALVKEANPDWTDQQVAQHVLQISSEAKANNVTAALKVLDNPEAFDPKTVAAAQEVLGSVLTKKAGSTTVAPPAGTPKGAKPSANLTSAAPAEKGSTPSMMDMKNWERFKADDGTYALKPGFDRNKKSSWVKVQ